MKKNDNRGQVINASYHMRIYKYLRSFLFVLLLFKGNSKSYSTFHKQLRMTIKWNNYFNLLFFENLNRYICAKFKNPWLTNASHFDSFSFEFKFNLLAMQETQIRFLGQEDTLEKEMATHSSILAWEIPCTRGAWQATVHGVSNSWTWQWLTLFL